jgi:hypothetical protein
LSPGRDGEEFSPGWFGGFAEPNPGLPKTEKTFRVPEGRLNCGCIESRQHPSIET